MSTVLDAAVVAALQADVTLQGLAPGGVFPDLAPEQQTTPFVIVALESHQDVDEQGGVAYEDATYVVMVVDKAMDAAAANAAYNRAHTVLLAGFAVTGYTLMSVARLGRQRVAERDGAVIWRFVSGRYRVLVDLT